MERKSTKKVSHVAPEATESILITQVVGHIVPGDSDQSMLAAAYLSAAQFIEENASDKSIHLSWTYCGGTFEANYLPPRVNDEVTEVAVTEAY